MPFSSSAAPQGQEQDRQQRIENELFHVVPPCCFAVLCTFSIPAISEVSFKGVKKEEPENSGSSLSAVYLAVSNRADHPLVLDARPALLEVTLQQTLQNLAVSRLVTLLAQ